MLNPLSIVRLKSKQFFFKSDFKPKNSQFRHHALKVASICMSGLFSTNVWSASTLHSPENIVVLSINQHAVKSGFLKNAKEYQIESGPAELTVRYQQYFDHGNSQHDILKSDDILIQIPKLQDQQRYRLGLVQAPEDFDAAKKYIEQPVIALYDQNHQQVAIQQRNMQRSKSLLSGLLGQLQTDVYAPATVNQSTSKQSVPSPTASNLSVIHSPLTNADNNKMQVSKDQQMIELWQKASKPERQKFISWLSDHE